MKQVLELGIFDLVLNRPRENLDSVCKFRLKTGLAKNDQSSRKFLVIDKVVFININEIVKISNGMVSLLILLCSHMGVTSLEYFFHGFEEITLRNRF
jgi:hypothetical protein